MGILDPWIDPRLREERIQELRRHDPLHAYIHERCLAYRSVEDLRDDIHYSYVQTFKKMKEPRSS